MRELGAVYGPYTGSCFASTAETDIEHIVAASEAHDSGLCAADAAIKARFARDLRNLTLAAPAVNRYQKSAKDAAEWAPSRNRCWFAARVVDVRRAYGLTIDRREAAALERILARCESTALEPVVCAAPSGSSAGAGAVAGDDALARYDDNRNGAITCAEARRHFFVQRGLVHGSTFGKAVDGFIGFEEPDERVCAACSGPAGAVCQHFVAFGGNHVFEPHTFAVPKPNAVCLERFDDACVDVVLGVTTLLRLLPVACGWGWLSRKICRPMS